MTSSNVTLGYPLHIPVDCWQSLDEQRERHAAVGLAYAPTVRSIGRKRHLLSFGVIAKLLDAAAQDGEMAVRYMTQHLLTESLAVIYQTARSAALQNVVHSGGRFPAALERCGIPRWMHRRMSHSFLDVPMSDEISPELLGQVPPNFFPSCGKDACELVILLFELKRYGVLLTSARRVIECVLAAGYGGSFAFDTLQALLQQCEAYCVTARAFGSELSMCEAIDLALERISHDKTAWGVQSILEKSISATVIPVFQRLGYSITFFTNEILRSHPMLPTHWAGFEVSPLDTVMKLQMAGIDYENCTRTLSQIVQYTGDGVAVYSMWRENAPYCMFALTLDGAGRVAIVENFHAQNVTARPMAKAMVQAFADSFNKADALRFREFTAVASAVRTRLCVDQYW